MRRVEGPELVAAEAKSFTGQYLRPLLSRSPAQAGAQAAKPRRSSRGKSKGAEEDQADLVAAK